MNNFFKRINKVSSKSFSKPLIIIILISFCISAQVFSQKKNITIIVDGHKSTFSTFKSTTADVLKDFNLQIGPKDKVTPALSAKISKNDVINIKKAVTLVINIDGKILNVQSSEDNIESMLKSEKILINSGDKIKPEKSTSLSEGLSVEIIRIETKNIVKTEPVEYKTITKKDSTKDISYKNILQEGKKGEKQIITTLIYENGREASRKIVSEKVTKKPIDKILVIGTIKKPVVSRGASNLSYSRIISAKATAYYAFKGVGKTYTATGRKAVRDPSGYSTIAVDPRIIPYGTRMYVEGYGYALAADTGGAIVGNKIDVYFDTRDEALNWGVKHVNVFILK